MGKCYQKLANCETNTVSLGIIECTKCSDTYLLSDNKCYLKITGCKTNTVNNGKVECSECLSDYHLISKSCQKKVSPVGCDGNANIVWKNGVDYCSKCEPTYYTFEGKCY